MGELTRRRLLASGLAVLPLTANTKGTAFPTETRKYEDPLTELDVYRLTDPAYSSVLPAYYNRSIAKSSNWLIYSCDREGSPQAFRLDLKSGQEKQLTQVEDLDRSSLTLTPDNRSFCYFAGRALYSTGVSSLHERELYRVPDGWERCPGMSVGPDGTHATFAERNQEGSRLRMVSLVQGIPRTVLESREMIADPQPRPMRAQVLYRIGDRSLWLVNADGQQNRELKVAEGRVAGANWAPDGRTVLYLNFPSDTTQLNNIRELTPDSNTDKLVAKTSQFAIFGFNRDASVFAGASRNAASPALLILLRVTRREFTLCEHKASQPDMVAPIFSPDSQRLYFQSDRHGKPALYCMHIEKLVEKTDEGG